MQLLLLAVIGRGRDVEAAAVKKVNPLQVSNHLVEGKLIDGGGGYQPL